MVGQTQVRCHVIGTVDGGTTPVELRIYRNGEDPKNSTLRPVLMDGRFECDVEDAQTERWHIVDFGEVMEKVYPLSNSGCVSQEVYNEFEYKIPEKADGELNTQNIVLDNSITIDILAGIYDWCITNPSPDLNVMFIASFNGNIGGRQNDYVFEAGMHYIFNIGVDEDHDKVDVEVAHMYGEWTQVAVGDGALATELTSLTERTKYVVQVQAVLANGKTSPWSTVASFTTTEEGIVTGVENSQSEPAKSQREGWYTIDGRKLGGKPTPKGVYTNNGKKTIAN